MNMIDKYEKLVKAQAGVLYLEGPPGSAKTAISEEMAKKNGWQYFQFILSQVDSADVAGIPHKHEVKGQICTVRTVPDWAIKANEQPTLVNFDELNRAPVECRNAALQILNERKVGDYPLNDNVYFISTGNIGEDGNRSDGAEVEEMDTALWGRLIYMPHEMPYVTWKEMYGKENIWHEVIAYLDSKPEHFEKNFEESKMNANPRTWTNFSHFIIRSSSDYDEQVALAKEFAKNFIGPQIAGSFNQYLEEKQLININSILDEWGRVKSTVQKFDRSRYSQLIAELNKKDATQFNKTQTKNLVKFLNMVHDDEKSNAVINNVLSNVDLSSEEAKEKIIKAIKADNPEDVWNMKMKKVEKPIYHLVAEFWDVIEAYLESTES